MNSIAINCIVNINWALLFFSRHTTHTQMLVDLQSIWKPTILLFRISPAQYKLVHDVHWVILRLVWCWGSILGSLEALLGGGFTYCFWAKIRLPIYRSAKYVDTYIHHTDWLKKLKPGFRLSGDFWPYMWKVAPRFGARFPPILNFFGRFSPSRWACLRPFDSPFCALLSPPKDIRPLTIK